MAERSTQSLPPEPPVQYSLSTALWGMTAVAMCAAAAGPIWRTLNPRERGAWALYTVAGIVAFAAYVSREQNLLSRLAQRAGAARFRLRYSRRRHDLLPRSRSSLPLLVIGAVAVIHFERTNGIERGEDGSIQLAAVGLLAGALVAACVVRSKRAIAMVPPIQLCENGILLVRKFMRWQRVYGFQPMPTRTDALTIRMLFMRLDVRVPDTIREDVEHFLREKVGPDAQGSPSRETASG